MLQKGRSCQQKKGARVQLFHGKAWMGSMIACAPAHSDIPFLLLREGVAILLMISPALRQTLTHPGPCRLLVLAISYSYASADQ